MNHSLIINVVFAIFCIILIIIAVILHNMKINCVFIFEDNSLNFKESTKKIRYKKLSFSSTSLITKSIFKYKNNLFSTKNLYKNQSYLFAISKFIDFKINTNKTKYRFKERKTLIEEISKYCVLNLSKERKPNLFSCLNKFKMEYNLKQKELKVFKLVLARDLIFYIYQNKRILDEMMKIIKKSKNAKYLRFYKNNLHFYSNIYGICNFNTNSNGLILKNNIDKTYATQRLFKELYRLKYNIDISINYLTIMFN